VLRDGTRYQPDLWNDALGFCIEVDGVANHSIASRMDSDRVRHNRLALELGIAVARFTPHRIRSNPAGVVCRDSGRCRGASRGYARRTAGHVETASQMICGANDLRPRSPQDHPYHRSSGGRGARRALAPGDGGADRPRRPTSREGVERVWDVCNSGAHAAQHSRTLSASAHPPTR
jgi:hypothetical protein